MSFPFKIPFAASGDQSTVPDSDLTGSVNFTDGYTPDYQADPSSDPNAKLIERDKFNFLMNKITGAVGEIQRQGAADWYADLAPYDLNAEVFYNGKRWRSTIANNSAVPGVGSEWLGVTPGTAASRDVGTAAGNVMQVGAFGLGSKAIAVSNIDAVTPYFALLRGDAAAVVTLNFPHTSLSEFAGQIRVNTAFPGALAIRGCTTSNNFTPWYLIWNQNNTTVDGNGFIKQASPIVNLFSDRIEANDSLEVSGAEFERVSTGHYVIRNVPLLSRDGWYIETPKDRNGNVYFTIDYDESIEGELTIRTYAPDYSTGRAENGAPVDIIDGRFVSLRFAASPETELPDDAAE